MDTVSELTTEYLKSLLEQDKIDKSKYSETMKRVVKLYEKSLENSNISHNPSEIMTVLLKFKKFVTYIDKNGIECVDENLINESKNIAALIGKSLFNIYKDNYGKDVLNEEHLQEMVTYTDKFGHVNYSTNFMRALFERAEFDNEIYLSDYKIHFINLLQQYKDENGTLQQGKIGHVVEISKSDINTEIYNTIVSAQIPVELRINSAAELSLEEIENYEDSGCKIEKVHIMSYGDQPYWYRFTNEQKQEYGSIKDNIFINTHVLAEIPYDIETYKKCREVIDLYLSSIDFHKLENNPNRDKIIFGKITKLLGMNVKYDWENRDTSSAHNMEGALLKGLAVCEGYAETARNIFECCGISTDLVIGVRMTNGKTGDGHAWNKVQLDGTWYNIDITQASSLIETDYCRLDLCNGKVTMFLLESDEDFFTANYMAINNSSSIHKCKETLPIEEVETYLYGNEQQIAMLPVRNNIIWEKPEEIIGDITSGEIKNAIDMLIKTRGKDVIPQTGPIQEMDTGEKE